MERTDTIIQHGRLRGVAGFGLLELLVALAISSILALSLWSLASTQERTYGTQDSGVEMQQNLRVALQRLSKDIMSAGLAPQSTTISGQDVSSWYNSANGWNPLRFTTTTLNIIGTAPPVTLSAAAAAGTNTLSVAAGASFSANQTINIAGVETAVVTAVAGNTLTLSANLTLTHPLGANVYPLRWVLYSLSGNVLSVNYHDGNGLQAVASNISAMNIIAAAADPCALTVTLTGTTGTTPAVSYQVTNTFYRRNS
jgi:type IV pilus assembly protein PilW